MEDKYVHLTDDLIQALLSNTHYKRLIELNDLINKDKDIKTLSIAFNHAKDQYYEAKKYGKYHPDLKRYQKVFQETKTALFTHDLIKAYKTEEKAFQLILDDISEKLAQTVSSQINFTARFKVSKKGG
ncbi:MAG: YlbF family regulator [Candidatus Izemoplasmataceae bacterium]